MKNPTKVRKQEHGAVFPYKTKGGDRYERKKESEHELDEQQYCQRFGTGQSQARNKALRLHEMRQRVALRHCRVLRHVRRKIEGSSRNELPSIIPKNERKNLWN